MLYVAKRFYEIGKGPGDVTCIENSEHLVLEAERLALGQAYLDAFYKLADEREAEVARGAHYIQSPYLPQHH